VSATEFVQRRPMDGRPPAVSGQPGIATIPHTVRRGQKCYSAAAEDGRPAPSPTVEPFTMPEPYPVHAIAPRLWSVADHCRERLNYARPAVGCRSWAMLDGIATGREADGGQPDERDYPVRITAVGIVVRRGVARASGCTRSDSEPMKVNSVE
jgi:hypothetical protein